MDERSFETPGAPVVAGIRRLRAGRYMPTLAWPDYADTGVTSPATRWQEYADSEVAGLRRSLTALAYRHAPSLMQRLRAAEGTVARCLEFAVLTAARTSKAQLAEWRVVDLNAALWTVPGDRMKSGEVHVVHLSARAIEILKAQRGIDQTLVFPFVRSHRRGQPQSNMALLATLGRLGVRDQTTVHGLCRSTFSTWANETGAARPDVIEACLAHREADKVKRAYNRAIFNEERRALLEAWADDLGKPAAQVLPFKATLTRTFSTRPGIST